MTKNTKSFMRSVKRKLEKLIDMHCTACGHEGPLAVAFQEEERLLSFIRAEVERLEEARYLETKSL